MSSTNKIRKIVCGSCNGAYAEDLPKCPFCGTLNIEGAEKEYFEKLEDVREDMEDLTEVPFEEVKTTLKKQTRYIRRVILAALVVFALLFVLVWWWQNQNEYERDARADYIWQRTNYPQMEEWYEQGEYDTLLDFYLEAQDGDLPVWGWEHASFCLTYENVRGMEILLEQEAGGTELGLYALQDLFYAEWCIIGMHFYDGMQEEDLERLEQYIAIAEQDVRERYALTEEEYNFFYEQVRQEDGHLKAQDYYDFVEQKMKDKGEE